MTIIKNILRITQEKEAIMSNRVICVVLGCGGSERGVPGRQLIARVESAIILAKKYPELEFVLSGGGVEGEDTEAKIMNELMTKSGIENNRIILEDKSSITRENIVFSVNQFRRAGFESRYVLVITERYHLMRAWMILWFCGQRIYIENMPRCFVANSFFRCIFLFFYELVAFGKDFFFMLVRYLKHKVNSNNSLLN
jgi:uncharacterized SAM-binding protein YcdF (DUF218 family)